ncbi:Uncharacterised protein [uncultured archaeon]|nr:Uncharacterised protein [uncultured archaeon]
MAKTKISKPWVIYGKFGNFSIGKIVEISGETCSIKYKEKSKDKLLWTFSLIKDFKIPEEAISYLLDNYPHSNYSITSLVKEVSKNFPKERKRLEKIIAQSSPKYTSESCRTLGDEIGRVTHPYQ